MYIHKKNVITITILIVSISILSSSITIVNQIASAQTNTNNVTSDEAIELNEKGVALGSLGKYDEAIVLYDKALAIEPNNALALNDKNLALDALNKN
ncbi:MAG TPA: tetratricopeptide repeat protein [Nitrososphaeraceae archaeon]|nr:tetratricopeptide repeat protein [Nitrososphaeraceae archaeon]